MRLERFIRLNWEIEYSATVLQFARFAVHVCFANRFPPYLFELYPFRQTGALSIAIFVGLSNRPISMDCLFLIIENSFALEEERALDNWNSASSLPEKVSDWTKSRNEASNSIVHGEKNVDGNWR